MRPNMFICESMDLRIYLVGYGFTEIRRFGFIL